MDNRISKTVIAVSLAVQVALVPPVETRAETDPPDVAFATKIPDLPSVAILATGGTIAERTNPQTGAAVPAVSAGNLIKAVPGLSQLANIGVLEISNIDSSQMTPMRWARLSRALDRILSRKEITGAIVTHGTDTMTAATHMPAPKTILMIAANPATSPTTGWPVGFWWAELTHPFWAFKQAGYRIEIVSPSGGDLQPDGFSDPQDDSGYSADDILSLGFKTSPTHSALLTGTKSIAEVNAADYDAIFLAGGQSPMGLDDYGIRKGNPANCVVLQARDPVEAIRLSATRLTVIRGGRIISETAPKTSRLSLPGRPDIVDSAAYAPVEAAD